MLHSLFCRLIVVTALSITLLCSRLSLAEFQAGAAAVDVTPQKFPVFVVGGMLSREATEVHTPLFAKAIVLDDGTTRVAIVVVDSCAMPRALLDEAKAMAARSTNIAPENILISATHTHSAPAAIGGLGTDPDPDYPPFLKRRLVEAIE